MEQPNDNGRGNILQQIVLRFTLYVLRFGEALRFLTIIPQPWLPPASAQSMAASIPWFPAAGLVIGALALPAGWLAGLLWGDLTRAVMVVAAWGIITAGLHLDGLSDTFDAVISWRSRERKLEIMKDSRIGAMGAIAIATVLLLKVALLAEAGAAWWQAALAAPALGRWAQVYALRWFPPAAAGGLGRAFHDQMRGPDFAAATLAAGLAALLIGGAAGLVALPLIWLCTHLLARWWTGDLGGLTGDTYGALCEIAEVVALAALTAARG